MARKNLAQKVSELVEELGMTSEQLAMAERDLRNCQSRVKLLRAEYVRLYQKFLALNGNKQRKPVFNAVFGTSNKNSDTATAPSAILPKPRRVVGKQSDSKMKVRQLSGKELVALVQGLEPSKSSNPD
jgi:hypothetical protein